MPYIPNEKRRNELREDPFQARTEGEVNFVFSVAILKMFNSNLSYKTINDLRAIVNKPSLLPEFENIFYQIPKGTSGLSHEDIRSALDNAWSEFYDRVGRVYENLAIELNGDLEEYQVAFKKIKEKKEKANGDKNKLSVNSGTPASSKAL